jgi:hypothetical protein
MSNTQVAQKGFPIVIGSAGLGELWAAGYVGTICFVTSVDTEGRIAGFTDIHVTRDQLELLRERVTAHLEALDEGLPT